MVRLALVGCGRMAEVHLRALQKVPEIEVRALADDDPERLERLCARYAVPRRYPGLEGVLADPELAAVAICLPPPLHAGAALEVLRAGRHLFVEKPLCLTRAEGRELAAQAGRSPGVIQVGFHLRHHPRFVSARERLSAGQLGPVHALRTCFSNPTGLLPQPAWRDSSQTGGGVLLNLGVHHFDLWRFLTGAQVAEVHAAGTDRHSVAVTGRLANGMLVSTMLSHVSADQNEVELYGGRARLRVMDYRFDGLEMQRVGHAPGGLKQRLRAALSLPGRLWHGEMLQRAYQAQWRRFALAVGRGASPGAGLEDGLWATEIALAAARSLELGSPVRLDEPSWR